MKRDGTPSPLAVTDTGLSVRRSGGSWQRYDGDVGPLGGLPVKNPPGRETLYSGFLRGGDKLHVAARRRGRQL